MHSAMMRSPAAALEENHRRLDPIRMMQRRPLAVALGIPLGIADQPVEVVGLELVGHRRQRQRIADAIEARAGAKYLAESQRAQRRVAACAAAAHEGPSRVDAVGQMGDHGAGIGHVGHAPTLPQRVTIGTAKAAAAAVVEVGDGEATLRPELDTRIEHGVAGRGRPAVQEHHQGRPLALGATMVHIQRRIKEAVGGLAVRCTVAQRLGTRDLRRRQRTLTAREHADRPARPVDRNHRRGAVRA